MADDRTLQLIMEMEGFRSDAYWDENAYRVGYGSDTWTDDNGGVHKVTKDTSGITQDQAYADLARRVPEFQRDGIIKQVGQQAWTQLSPETQAAVTSLAYNYGSISELPSLKSAIESGNTAKIASAIEARGADNGGMNETRRQREAALVTTLPPVVPPPPNRATAAIDEALGIDAPADPLGYAAPATNTIAKPTAAQLQAIRDPMAASAPKLDQQLLQGYAENYVPTTARIPQTVRPGVPGALPADPAEPVVTTVKGYGNGGADTELLDHMKYMLGENLERAPILDWKGRERSTNIGVLPPPAVVPVDPADYLGFGNRTPTKNQFEALTAAQQEYETWLNNGGSLPSDSTPEEIAAQQTAYQKRSMEAGTPLKLTGGAPSEDDPAAVLEAALGTTTSEGADIDLSEVLREYAEGYERPAGVEQTFPSEALVTERLKRAQTGADPTVDPNAAELTERFMSSTSDPGSPTVTAEAMEVARPYDGTGTSVNSDQMTYEDMLALVAKPPVPGLTVLDSAWSPSTSGRVLTGDEPLVPIAPPDALDKERLTADTDGLPLTPTVAKPTEAQLRAIRDPMLAEKAASPPKTTTWADLFKMREPAQVAPIPATRTPLIPPIPATRSAQVAPIPATQSQGLLASRTTARPTNPSPWQEYTAADGTTYIADGLGDKWHRIYSQNNIPPMPATMSGDMQLMRNATPPRKPPLEITVNGGAPEIPPMPMPRPASRMPNLLAAFNQPKPVAPAPVPAVKGNGPDSILGRIQARRAAKAAAQASQQGTSSSSSSTGKFGWGGDSSYDSPEAQALLAWASNN